MLPVLPRAVNAALPLLAGLILACTPSRPPQPAPARPPGEHLNAQRSVVAEGLRRPNGLNDALARGHLGEPPYATSLGQIDGGDDRAPQPTDMEGLGPAISDASVDDTLGQALLDYVDENVSSRNWSTYGVASLTYDEIWGTDGTDGLCEEGAILSEFDEDGASYEASYGPGIYGSFIGNISAVTESMDEGCAEALLANGGDVDGALEAGDCDAYTEHTFFAEGTDCRTCIEARAGDYDACVDEGACREEAPAASWTVNDEGETVWMRTAVGLIWACAPDLPVPMYLMADITEDGEIPETFDHAAWAHFCLPYWDEDAREPVYGCSSGPGLGHTIGAGVVGRVNYIREQGEDGAPHYNRVWYASSVSLSARTKIKYFWATVPGAGQISLPNDSRRPLADPEVDLSDEPLSGDDSVAGWGYNPHALRPDGTDPDELDDTYARDWLATLVLKTATTKDGILIQTYDHSRCLEWSEPDDEGRHLCTSLGPPDPAWKEDVDVGYWVDFDGPGAWTEPGLSQLFYTPMATIASTGLPDALVPGGAVPLVAGTANLADPDWEDCAWPHQFVPDVAVHEPDLHTPGAAGWLWGDTYRFGKDPDLDLRVVLNTNQWRGFCPERQD